MGKSRGIERSVLGQGLGKRVDRDRGKEKPVLGRHRTEYRGRHRGSGLGLGLGSVRLGSG